MGFMQAVVEEGQWYVVETSQGTEVVPAEVIGQRDPPLEAFADFVEGEPESYALRDGFGARTSAPGYMDATEWTFHETERAAWDQLVADHPDVFCWIVEDDTAHIYAPSTPAAEALVAGIQSLSGTNLERDGEFVYCAGQSGDELRDELELAGFEVEQR